ncbi:F0F1 ATP synthase subunit epsilon [Cellulomonas sp. P24]|uniref:F0F1 ATP synthase subunit epsilon n=1 Tax=Cellulomonas sp. P24 TaxID=2885206 RepID=UPI00216ABD00|nr:F0F1 ATP synthase subunit epsilon [Cellulomonas sp. P24]MCR6493939.1 F0F1 ATP synthase subunit epsilon [Cellulomonas sp. P24]
MAHLEVELVDAEGRVWSGQAAMVTAPTVEGEIGILVGHEPLLAVLRAGEVRIKPAEGPTIRGTVNGGFLSVDSDTVTVVADEAIIVSGAGTSTR